MSQLAWLCSSGSKRSRDRPRRSIDPVSAYRPCDSTLGRHSIYHPKFDHRLASTPSAWYWWKCCSIAYLVWPARLNLRSLIIYSSRLRLCLWRVEYCNQCRRIAISRSYRSSSQWADRCHCWLVLYDSVYKLETRAPQSTCHRRQVWNC